MRSTAKTPYRGPTAGEDTELELALFDNAMSSERLTEPLLTKSMGRMLAADVEAAGRFEGALLRQVAPDLRPHKRARCLFEHGYYLGPFQAFRFRRADLIFCSVDGRRVVIVEAKLTARTGVKQIADSQRIDVRDIGGIERGAHRYVALLANHALAPHDKTNARVARREYLAKPAPGSRTT